jgi:hypothetical protein
MKLSDEDRKNLLEFVLWGYIILNGVSTGMLIRYLTKMQPDTTNGMATLLTAGAWFYTAHRIHQIWQDKQNLK